MRERLQRYNQEPVFSQLQKQLHSDVHALHSLMDEARYNALLSENALIDLSALMLRVERLSQQLQVEEERVRDFIKCSVAMFREYRRFFYDLSLFKESVLEPGPEPAPTPTKRTRETDEYESVEEEPQMPEQEDDELGDLRLPLIQIRRELALVQQSTKRPSEKAAVVPQNSALNTVESGMSHMSVRCENGMLIESWRQESRSVDIDRVSEPERMALQQRYDQHLLEMERHMLCYQQIVLASYGGEAQAVIDLLRQITLDEEMETLALALAASLLTLRRLMDQQRENLQDYAMNCGAKFGECSQAYNQLAMALREAYFVRSVKVGNCVEPRLRGMYPYVKHVEQ